MACCRAPSCALVLAQGVNRALVGNWPRTPPRIVRTMNWKACFGGG